MNRSLLKINRPNILLFIVLSGVFLFYSLTWAETSSAKTAIQRDKAINKEFDCIYRRVQDKNSLAWDDVCYDSPQESARRQRIDAVNQALDEQSFSMNHQGQHMASNNPPPDYGMQDDSWPPSNRSPSIPPPNGSLPDNLGEQTGIQFREHEGDFGFEISRFLYREPDAHVQSKGDMYGVYGSYTYRPTQDDPLFSELLNMFKFDARFNYGPLDYEGSGTAKNIDDYMIEFRGVTGKDLFVTAQDVFTPYVGLGFRRLHDGGGDVIGSTGLSGYDRDANYFYAPLGFDILHQINTAWRLGLNLEYDFFLNGTQYSHLSNVDVAYGDVKNNQSNGFGMRGSIKIIKMSDPVNFVIEPFFRYWHIRNSDLSYSVGPGGFVSVIYEPDNFSKEYGLKLGVQY